MQFNHVVVVPVIAARHSRAAVLLVSCACGVVFLGGCKAETTPRPFASSRTMTARHTADPVNIDGVLDDPVWGQTPTYQLLLGEDRLAEGNRLRERGEVRLAWDEHHFYAAIEFHDSDIVAGYDVNQVHHYQKGDLVELLLKPEHQTWHWELYATPRNRKTSFWWPQQGTLTVRKCGLRIAARCRGTLNDSSDKDRSWTAEMAMPVRDLTTQDQPFGPGSQWRILVSRYNHESTLSSPELSAVPRLSRTDFQLTDEFAPLKLVGQPGAAAD